MTVDRPTFSQFSQLRAVVEAFEQEAGPISPADPTSSSEHRIRPWLIRNGIHPEFARALKPALVGMAHADAGRDAALEANAHFRTAIWGAANLLNRSSARGHQLRALVDRSEAQLALQPSEVVLASRSVIGAKPKARATRVASIQYTADRHFDAAMNSADPAVAKRAQTKFVDGNSARLQSLCAQACDEGARVIVLPEGSLMGYESLPARDPTTRERILTWGSPQTEELVYGFRRAVTAMDPSAVAMDLNDSPLLERWVSFVREQSEKAEEPVYVVLSVLEKMPREHAQRLEAEGKLQLFESQMKDKGWVPKESNGPVFINTALVLGPNGVEATHRKTRRWMNEYHLASAIGTEPTTVDTPYGRFGVQICLGFIDQDVAGHYRDNGVDAVLFPGDWASSSPAYDGFVGPSAHSWDFIAKTIGLDVIGADDGQSS
ncbi:MAG: nitrilase-related carbon-nitrogen hydrolase, partial [Myxococcota bacterium]